MLLEIVSFALSRCALKSLVLYDQESGDLRGILRLGRGPARAIV